MPLQCELFFVFISTLRTGKSCWIFTLHNFFLWISLLISGDVVWGEFSRILMSRQGEKSFVTFWFLSQNVKLLSRTHHMSVARAWKWKCSNGEPCTKDSWWKVGGGHPPPTSTTLLFPKNLQIFQLCLYFSSGLFDILPKTFGICWDYMLLEGSLMAVTFQSFTREVHSLAPAHLLLLGREIPSGLDSRV